MDTIATLERVRQAWVRLRKNGRPSADRIIEAIGGGSKTTVLGHMRTIAEEEARAPEAPDIPLQLLTRAATMLASKLWTQASTMADAAYESKFETMLATQNSLFEELRTAAVAEEGLQEDLKAARTRIGALEQELQERARADRHLAEIAELLKSRETPQYKPIIQFLRLLASDASRDREEVFRRMIELGHTIKQARTARYHALKEVYAKETPAAEGRFTLEITDLGRSRLPNVRRTA